jgi:hypothetical protein
LNTLILDGWGMAGRQGSGNQREICSYDHERWR